MKRTDNNKDHKMDMTIIVNSEDALCLLFSCLTGADVGCLA